jgi:ribosome-binding factor A
MRSFPRSRVTGETVRGVVARALLEDIKDPRVELVTVTGVSVSPDLRYATVYVAVHGDEARHASALAGLDSAKGRIRATLGRAVSMRYVPELTFAIDPSVAEAARISELIRDEIAAGRGGGADEEDPTDAAEADPGGEPAEVEAADAEADDEPGDD